MILILAQWLSQMGIKVPSVFSYASTRMMLSALTSFFITLFLGPWCIRWLYAMKTGQSIRVEDCPVLVELHQKKKNTPTMGGILLLVSMVVSQLMWSDLRSPYTLILIVTTLWLGGLGAMDDYLKQKHKNSKGLSSKKKFLAQVAFAALLGVYLLIPQVSEFFRKGSWMIPTFEGMMGTYFFPFIKEPIFTLTGGGLILAFFILIFVIVGSSNAVNLTDGLDGLATGLVLMVAFVFSLIAFFANNSEMSKYLNILYIEGGSEIAVFLAGLVGASLGFLWYNGHPAQVFMGDTGSLALGGILGVSAVVLRREFLFALVGGIFVMEALSVILQVASYKFRNQKRIFLCAPVHHHFEYKGWPETKVVLRFWIVGLILAVIGIASLKFQ